ncbi:MAG: GIY-YIG nuclease family protein [Campylobacterota bacterium]|nr:GIY-YIG nuclease family protein [Campylobacterota bacterium]
MYYVYMVKCADNTLYTGIATELERRIEEHNGSDKGARYTRIRRPVSLVYSEEYPDRSLASKREYEIKKKMNRAEKLKLIEG